MPRLDCPCCGSKGTPKRFRSLSAVQLRSVNRQRIEIGLPALPEGVQVRYRCHYKALSMTKGETHIHTSTLSSSSSEDETAAAGRNPSTQKQTQLPIARKRLFLDTDVDQTSCSVQENVTLPFSGFVGNSEVCFVCRVGPGLRNVPIPIPAGLRGKLFIRTNILLPNHNVLCSSHLQNDYLTEEAESLVKNTLLNETTTISTEDLVSLLLELATAKLPVNLDFGPDSTITNEMCVKMLGIDRSQFLHLHTFVEGRHGIHNSKHRSSYNSLAIFLMKIRLNLSHSVLAALFGGGLDKCRISYTIGAVRELLHTNFVPSYLGFGAISRERYVREHHTEVAEALLQPNGRAIIIVDGTYLYIQKSRNYKLQRRTYSQHKYRNLVKCMMYVSPSGYILDVGRQLFYADGRNNDAAIFISQSQDTRGLMNWSEPGDILVWDRGFRDANDVAKNLGFNISMPHFLPRGQRQHTTQEANESRMVTKIRWVVESVNGRVKKKFRFFMHNIENSYLSNLGELFQIACALLNAYSPPLKTTAPEDAEVCRQMLERVQMPNLLQDLIINEGLDKRRVVWEAIRDDSLLDFPRLSEEALRHLTCGVYQIKQAASYTGEHLSEDGMYELQHHRDEQYKHLLFAKIQSRHTSSSTHYVFVHYLPGVNEIKGIAGWYCRCPAGARVVGCCAHISSVIWYLSHARYLPRLVLPASNIDDAIADASVVDYYATTSDSE